MNLESHNKIDKSIKKKYTNNIKVDINWTKDNSSSNPNSKREDKFFLSKQEHKRNKNFEKKNQLIEKKIKNKKNSVNLNKPNSQANLRDGLYMNNFKSNEINKLSNKNQFPHLIKQNKIFLSSNQLEHHNSNSKNTTLNITNNSQTGRVSQAKDSFNINTIDLLSKSIQNEFLMGVEIKRIIKKFKQEKIKDFEK